MKISNFDEGMDAYNDQDYKTAFDIFQVLAKDNNADALNQLGGMYEFGKFVDENREKAFCHYKKAANLNHADAQNNLGLLIWEEGETHTEQSIYWCEKAAKQGHARAQCEMGDVYHYGGRSSVDNNIDYAWSWYLRSAENGYDFALEQLDELSFLECSTDDDDKRSIDHYRSFSKKGDINAKFWLAWAYNQGRGVIADGEKALTLYKEVAALQHYRSADAKWSIGVAYLYGSVVKKNNKLAEIWLVRATKGNADYQNRLAEIYSFKNSLGKNYKKAVDLYKSVINGNSFGWAKDRAYNGLGIYYFQIKEDYEQAFQCFKSSEHEPSSQHYLGHLYEYGKGIKRNDKKAVDWYKKAAKGGSSEAQYCLGSMYDHGSVVKQDDKLAIKWYAKSAAQGNVKAKNCLHAVCYYDRIKDIDKVINFDPNTRRIEYTHDEVYKASSVFGENKDCAVVATAIVCGINYSEVHKLFLDEGRLYGHGSDMSWTVRVLTILEKTNLEIFSQDRLEKMKADLGRGLTSNNIVKVLPKGRYIIHTKRHVAALVDGKIKDWTTNRRFRIKNIIKIPDKRENKPLSDEQINTLSYFNTGQLHLNFFRESDEDHYDYHYAFKCFKTAADEGHVKAHTQLARMYDQGIGVKKDSYKAARWYTSAAQCGDSEAQYEIAKKYEFGDGVDKDFAISRRWLFTMADNLKKTLGSDWSQMSTEPDF